MNYYIAHPTSRKHIRYLANTVRELVGLSDEKFFPVVEFLEHGLTRLDDKFHYEIVPFNEMRNTYALTFPEFNKIEIREDVYENAIKGIPRDRFTIAHETGHYLMHSPSSLALARDQVSKNIPAYKDPEWQANTFAGELLAPPHIIKDLTIQEIQNYCGVSYSVAEIQLKH